MALAIALGRFVFYFHVRSALWASLGSLMWTGRRSAAHVSIGIGTDAAGVDDTEAVVGGE